MGRKRQFRYEQFQHANSRNLSVGFPAFQKAFLEHFKEELKYHEGPIRADLADIYHEYVESKLTLREFLEQREGVSHGQKKKNAQ